MVRLARVARRDGALARLPPRAPGTSPTEASPTTATTTARSRPLSTCDFSDFRPRSSASRSPSAASGSTCRAPGTKKAAWLLAPRRSTPSASPPPLGELRAHGLPCAPPRRGFAALRCGDVPDRHGQIDMLHLDVWWRGLNVLVDGGTYLYSGERKWLDHFTRTASHNTVAVDGRDQMLHWRQFVPVPTKARLLAFRDDGRVGLMASEHTGYARHPGGCVHRRAVLALGEDCVIVIDRVTGQGTTARLHWLAAPFRIAHDVATMTLTLDTPRGLLPRGDPPRRRTTARGRRGREGFDPAAGLARAAVRGEGPGAVARRGMCVGGFCSPRFPRSSGPAWRCRTTAYDGARPGRRNERILRRARREYRRRARGERDVTAERIVFVAGARPNFMKVAPMLPRDVRGRRPRAPAGAHQAALRRADVRRVLPRARDPRAGRTSTSAAARGAQTAKILAAFEEWLLAQPKPRAAWWWWATSTPPWPARSPRRSSAWRPTSRPGCARTTGRCPRRSNPRGDRDAVADLLLTSEAERRRQPRAGGASRPSG